jgi:glycosyltransferase involved in cell wall biosynthesis
VKPLRVAVITNTLAHYRVAFFQSLFDRSDLDVRVFCQRSIPGFNLELAYERFPDRVTLVRAWTLSQERLGWQWLPWRRLLTEFDVVFVPGNLRILSGVCLALAARLLRRPTVLWGQLHNADSDPRREGIRLRWWRSFDHFLLYTDGEAARLRALGFQNRYILGMNNGLDQKRIDLEAGRWDEERLAAWRKERGLADRTMILSCARLSRKNRFERWVRVMPQVVERHPDLLWCVIGDGSERPALEDSVDRANLSAHVRWLGSILNESELAPWFLSSRWLVHPGAIGLTLLHAFGYGLPVVTHGDSRGHTPEFDAFEPGGTGLLYDLADETSLAAQVNAALDDPGARDRMGARAREIARRDYNVDVMSERFARIALHAAAGRDPSAAPRG